MPRRPETHRPERAGKKPDDRPSSSLRGYGRRWRKLRAMCLARDPVCTECGQKPSHHADHVTALAKGGTNGLENLRGLCHGCHSRKTVQEDGGFGRERK